MQLCGIYKSKSRSPTWTGWYEQRWRALTWNTWHDNAWHKHSMSMTWPWQETSHDMSCMCIVYSLIAFHMAWQRQELLQMSESTTQIQLWTTTLKTISWVGQWTTSQTDVTHSLKSLAVDRPHLTDAMPHTLWMLTKSRSKLSEMCLKSSLIVSATNMIENHIFIIL